MLGVETLEETGALKRCRAAATTNAAAKVWPDAEIHEATCNAHVNIRWFSNNAEQFNDGKAHRKNCGKGIEYGFKNTAHVNLVEVQKRKMIQKWKEEYKEPVVADDWCESWGRLTLSHVKTNSEDLSPLRGGIRCDNNAIEGGNGSVKKALDFKKCSLFIFLNELSTELVENASLLDVKYECPLKRRCGKNGHNKSVFTMAYFCWTLLIYWGIEQGQEANFFVSSILIHGREKWRASWINADLRLLESIV
jgi:hypothetical protein